MKIVRLLQKPLHLEKIVAELCCSAQLEYYVAHVEKAKRFSLPVIGSALIVVKNSKHESCRLCLDAFNGTMCKILQLPSKTRT